MGALATEFQWDRRTMAKRLEGLEPAKVKEISNRTEKSYYMSDVLNHLNRARSPKEAKAEYREDIKRYLGDNVFLGITNNPDYVGTLLTGLTQKTGITKHQAIEIYKLVTVSIMAGISSFCEDPDMKFNFEGLQQFLLDKGTDEYVKNHWPEFNGLE